jgi:hypothetical protein
MESKKDIRPVPELKGQGIGLYRELVIPPPGTFSAA